MLTLAENYLGAIYVEIIEKKSIDLLKCNVKYLGLPPLHMQDTWSISFSGIKFIFVIDLKFLWQILGPV